MCLASPWTTASVTLTSGCSAVPDFSAYLRAYAHILSTFACDGSAMVVLLRSRQRFVDLVGVEPAEPLPADEDHRQRRESQLHQLLARAGVSPDVALGERHALLRQILCRAVTGPSADVRVDRHLRRHRSSSPRYSGRTTSPTRMTPSLRICARSPPRWTSAAMTPSRVSPSRYLHGSQSRVPRRRTSPTRKTRSTRWLSGTPRVATFRRVSAGESLTSRPPRASRVSVSISVISRPPWDGRGE